MRHLQWHKLGINPHLNRTSTKADLIREIQDCPGSNAFHRYEELFPFSDTDKFMGIIL